MYISIAGLTDHAPNLLRREGGKIETDLHQPPV